MAPMKSRPASIPAVHNANEHDALLHGGQANGGDGLNGYASPPYRDGIVPAGGGLDGPHDLEGQISPREPQPDMNKQLSLRYEDANQISKMRTCSEKTTDFLHHWKRLGLFVTFISDLFGKLLMYVDIAALLTVAYNTQHSNPQVMACALGLVLAPFVATWGSSLMVIESLTLGGHPATIEKMAKLLVPFYLFLPPVGWAMIAVADVLCFVKQELLENLTRWLIGKKKTEKVATTRLGESFPRQRQHLHALCQSLPEIPLFAYLYATDCCTGFWGLDRNTWLICMLIGSLNLLWNLWAWVAGAREWKVGVYEYILPSIRLLGGIIPGFGKIKKQAETLDWTNFAFGRWTYIQFIELLEDKLCQMKEIHMSRKTLCNLPPNLCFHFGETLKEKSIEVSIYAAPNCEDAFRQMDIKNDGYISIDQLKVLMPKTRHFEDVEPDKFGPYIDFMEDGGPRLHFSRFKASSESRQYKQLLHITNPMLLSTKCKDSRLFQFLLGLRGTSSQETGGTRKKTMRVVIKDMIEKEDMELFKLLQHQFEECGGFTAADWRCIGYSLADAIKDKLHSRISFLIKICKQCNDLGIHPFAATDSAGNNVVHWAVMCGEAASLQQILDNFVEPAYLINASNTKGESPISLSVSCNNTEITNILQRYQGYAE